MRSPRQMTELKKTMLSESEDAATILQKSFRRWKRRIDKCTNDTDFVSFEDLRGIRFFHGTNQFNPISLHLYIRESGNFHNPYTRVLLSDKDLDNLDEITSLFFLPQLRLQKEEIIRKKRELQQEDDSSRSMDYIHHAMIPTIPAEILQSDNGQIRGLVNSIRTHLYVQHTLFN